jgi:hypothetical protein
VPRAAAPGNAPTGAPVRPPRTLGGFARWIQRPPAPWLCPTAPSGSWVHTDAVWAVGCTQQGQAVQGRRGAARGGVWGGSAPGRVRQRHLVGFVRGPWEAVWSQQLSPWTWSRHPDATRLIFHFFRPTRKTTVALHINLVFSPSAPGQKSEFHTQRFVLKVFRGTKKYYTATLYYTMYPLLACFPGRINFTCRWCSKMKFPLLTWRGATP